MASQINNKEIYKIEWNLSCPVEEAVRILSESVESFIRPCFLTKTNLKGFIVGNKFLIWPNTYFSDLTDIVIVGSIKAVGNNSQLKATAKLLPPFSWFPSKESTNIVSGLIMVISWICVGIGMVTENFFLSAFFAPFFVVTCLYNLIQLKRFIQKPELVDLRGRFQGIFKGWIMEKQESIS